MNCLLNIARAGHATAKSRVGLAYQTLSTHAEQLHYYKMAEIVKSSVCFLHNVKHLPPSLSKRLLIKHD